MRSPAKAPRGLVWLGILSLLGPGGTVPMAWAQAPARSGPSRGPKQVLIIRHAEKPGDPSVDGDSSDPDLSTRGYERAAALAVYLPATFPAPEFLFATRASTQSNRPVETITPLAAALHLEIDSKHANDAYQKVAQDVLSHPKYAGKRVLICWHHGKIPELARALGVQNPPATWKGSVFDRVWQIDYSGGQADLTDLPQKLLYGDSAE